ncbi:molybdopterin molybdotransferase MoeA [Leucobacter allii]|uniref:molybdopterin molybdotransferase MoeA n=1 Tax=Leucobacter allii TaxID=2932247 RepID=UPI001FD4CD0C|nr:gephyrin-like molybdotransferase Glp [Leucobacter allii]UOR02730.1 molybdopterin molybdotransferase MoeA [Leucobacter allii]
MSGADRPAATTPAEHAARVAELVGPVLAALRDAEPERLAVDDPGLPGRVTAAELRSGIPLPPFDNSQMDGYAVRVADLGAAGRAGPRILRIGAATAAGDPPIPHEAGTAAPVMTGAAIPIGADAVIPIEQADPPRFDALRRPGPGAVADVEPGGACGAAGDAPSARVAFATVPEPGAFIRRRGSDLPAGAVILPAGTRLRPSGIGLLANAGVAVVPVRRRPRVLLVSTGDEVTAPGAPLAPGRVYDANAPLLAAALRAAGAEVTAIRIADRPEALTELVAGRGGAHELLVTSGGISAGAFEVVREALAPAGVAFSGIAMQPGGPQGAGVAACGGVRLPALCFPGNPVSSAVSAELFLLPLLRLHAGLPAGTATELRPLAHDVDSPPRTHQLRRGRLDAEGRVVLTPPSSHLLADLAAAELLAHIPLGVAHLAAGSPIEIQRFDV